VSSAELHAIAQRHLALAGAHHLALIVILTLLWTRRRGMERTVAAYFTSAFATAALALLTESGTRPLGAVAAALAALWATEVVRPRGTLSFEATPRGRLAAMALLGLFGFAYPGYSGELPSFLFSPMGVLLPPSLLVATALLNCVAPRSNRLLHWAHAVSAGAIGAVVVRLEGWTAVPLFAVSAYAAALLLGRGRIAAPRDPARETTVRQIRDRMYSRRTLLPGPHDPRRRRLPVRRRR